jgi:hypothetical protein
MNQASDLGQLTLQYPERLFKGNVAMFVWVTEENNENVQSG